MTNNKLKNNWYNNLLHISLELVAVWLFTFGLKRLFVSYNVNLMGVLYYLIAFLILTIIYFLVYRKNNIKVSNIYIVVAISGMMVPKMAAGLSAAFFSVLL